MPGVVKSLQPTLGVDRGFSQNASERLAAHLRGATGCRVNTIRFEHAQPRAVHADVRAQRILLLLAGVGEARRIADHDVVTLACLSRPLQEFEYVFRQEFVLLWI